MKPAELLIVTQAVDQNHPALGFFIEWLEEFSRRSLRVHVIARSVGRHSLPGNVIVRSMGAEAGAGRLRRHLNFWRNFWSELRRADAVFIHMCPEYLLAAWPLLLFRRRPVIMWFSHRQRSWQLALALKMADRVLTISPGSFPIASAKVRTMGHGIPVERFMPAAPRPGRGRLLTVGRITPIKNLDRIIKAIGILRDRGVPASLDVVGEPQASGDLKYLAGLKFLVSKEKLDGAVRFVGSVPYRGLFSLYADYDAHVNAAPTGALDKAALEAMAAGLPSVVVNASFRQAFGPDASRLVAGSSPESLAGRLAETMGDAALGLRLKAMCARDHSLDRLIAGIMKQYDELA